MTNSRIANIARDRRSGAQLGITSVCTAHPLVIEAALLQGQHEDTDVLIEATCNQVNQEGGYTGMTPADFRRFVGEIAARVGFDTNRLILGGDHLGPNPWKHLPPEEAMSRAAAMVNAYAKAGFTKFHLDTSMGCAGENIALTDEMTAERAAHLAKIADAATDEAGTSPVYVIGTEVPVPGGALESINHLEVTSAEAALKTVDVHRQAFAAAGVSHVFERVVGVVVQPGVEFGNANVVGYDREKARSLSAALSDMPQFIFEAHSTDYQSADALRALVEDGFAILKVGPWLTFALREALYGLDHIAQVLDPTFAEHGLIAAIERLMLSKPDHWQKYYHGNASELRLQRHFSYSDRIRYYWPHAEAEAAVNRLLTMLDGRSIPETLVSQYLGALYPAVLRGQAAPDARSLQLAAVRRVLGLYARACRPTD
ncbi:D-tagatose-bisphosphate aldolase, class II, non-catalytic subunit [Rhizobium rosettiformans]|uniref:D-tagatose-bisphosphate aldolase, class II, non-catalytic subunit n=1 Tax=Rhizobium rosettiformans TaxID=1368430 RepID=UPI00285A55FE|nr:D-tagatose-bisphosphate aldolase, class II, non-catalytic subunit [Rhizobium rosettiformans]MDR7031161.1 D-tagatose-1,6-bisphosphate aldolase subunit GatZ/KbaZ [Rhizobium rosettiformans]MDR7066726.1 D-tagatose-1,6-bisphosphate aldolase subunit GatZ/KbaZ [Rhizobium rosettiformans]